MNEILRGAVVASVGGAAWVFSVMWDRATWEQQQLSLVLVGIVFATLVSFWTYDREHP